MTILAEVKKTFGFDDLYKVLQISPDANAQEIKKAYLARSLELHPDKISDVNKKEEFKHKFQILREVYQVLSVKTTKDDYDSQFQNGLSPERTHESSIHEEIHITECNNHTNHHSYGCRCSGSFILDKSHLSNSRESSNAFIIDCDSCSNSIKIIT